MRPEEQELRVRDAVPVDAERVAGIARRAWPAAYRGLFDKSFIDLVLDQAYHPAAMRDRIEEARGADAEFLVADEAGHAVGFLHFGPGERGAELRALYVEPERIGAGIGHALLGELNRRLRPGTEYVALVREGNDLAIRFYERHGFEQAELVNGFDVFAAHHGLRPPAEERCGRDPLMRYRVPAGTG
ncbi:MAG: GNAT family N-acetyltransferase [Thermoleophilaceae bacterium]